MLLENQSYPADVRVRSEAEALARNGYDVKVIAPRAAGERAHAVVAGVTVSRFRLPAEGGGAIGILVEYLLANVQLHLRATLEILRGVRILHLHNPPDTLFLTALAVRLLGGRAVYDHHDLAPELFAAKFGGRSAFVVRMLRVLERLSMLSANRVLAANESHREVAIGRGGRDAAVVTVVRNGPPVAVLGGPSHRRGELAEPRLVFVGSMAEQDGVVDLADVIVELQQQHGVCARLTAVGDGPARRALEQRCRTLGIGNRLRMTGRVHHTKVPELIADADICLDPAPCTDLNHRSTMVKVAEYLAAGRPVVAYRLRETLHTADGVALLARCGDRQEFVAHIARLVREESLRRELSERALQRARELTWEHSETALLGAYAQL